MTSADDVRKNSIKNGFVDLYFSLSEKKDRAMALKSVKKQLQGIPELSGKQKAEIKDFWMEHLGVDVPLEWHRLFYAKTGIEDPSFVPPPVYEYDIRPRLNHPNFGIVCSNKVYLDRLIVDSATVTSVLRRSNRRYLNRKFELIDREEAKRVISEYESLVVKPALFSKHGDSVKLIKAPYNLDEIDERYGDNYVMQIPLVQHAFLKEFNPSSTNAVRVVTVLLDDKPHVVNSYLRVGSKGEFADNAGNDRYLIGIRDNGRMADYALDSRQNVVREIPSGVKFGGAEFPGYEEMCRSAEKAHENLSFFGLVAFDICIDKDAHPVIVETNLKQPAVNKQIASGPYFGKYTVDVLEYCKRRNITKEVGWPQMW